MAVRSYYEILGVSRKATLEEITNAKIALAKVYHPDANLSSGIDTTEQMQEILEAYRILSDPEKRKEYDREIGGEPNRVFRTFNIKEEAKNTKKEDLTSFVTYWNAASSLYALVEESAALLEKESHRTSITIKVLQKVGKMDKTEKKLAARLNSLSLQALPYITLLRKAEIPMEYWLPEPMNWILLRWSQCPGNDYHTLIAQYDAHINRDDNNSERIKRKNQIRRYHNKLKKLLTYAI